MGRPIPRLTQGNAPLPDLCRGVDGRHRTTAPSRFGLLSGFRGCLASVKALSR
jgi:hypothetical protein